MTLSEFLLARIAEDEAVARAATEGPWECANVHQSYRVQTVKRCGASPEPLAITMDSEGLSDSIDATDGEHVARWNPARVLAECEAKRRIVMLHHCAPAVGEPWDPVCTVEGYGVTTPNDCDTLRALALPYADHPDYRDEWRP